VLLDGIPLNEPGGSFYLNNLTTENLDRIEIVRGAYSSLFGSDAMASVIQLFTRRADGTVRRPQGAVQVDGGTYGTIHASASVAGATSRVDYSGGVAQYNSDNRVENSGLENTTLSGNLGVRVGSSATLRLVTRAELSARRRRESHPHHRALAGVPPGAARRSRSPSTTGCRRWGRTPRRSSTATASASPSRRGPRATTAAGRGGA